MKLLQSHSSLAAALILILAPNANAQSPQPRGRDGATMVRVEAGPFVMGSDSGGDPDEQPRHSLTLPAYWIDVHEVTNAQYGRFCKETGRKLPVTRRDGAYRKGRDEWPATGVTWEDAAAYARWAGKRLPAEAEWEKAARGTDGREYPWGAFAQGGSFHNLGFAALEDEKQLGPVGRFPKGTSPCGCLDMTGNAWEWTSDWYNPYPQGRKPNTPHSSETIMTATYSPLSPHFGKKYKVIRGGGAIGYYGIPNTGRCADRARGLPFAGYDGTGFRCVMDDGAPRSFDTDISPAYEKPPPTIKPVKPVLNSPVVLVVTEPAGVARTDEIVTSGIPFAEGALGNLDAISLADSQGRAVPLHLSHTGRWRDGSVKWVTAEFPCSVGAGQSRRYLLYWNYERTAKGITFTRDHVQNTSPLPGSSITVTATSGPLTRKVTKAFNRTRDEHDTVGRRVDTTETRFDGPVGNPVFVAREMFDMHGRTQGNRLIDNEHTTFELSVSLTQVSATPIVPLKSWDIPFRSPTERHTSCMFGGDRKPHAFTISPADTIELVQRSEREYVILRNGREVARGTRAPGWVQVRVGTGYGTGIAVREFWQQFPMALRVDSSGVTIRCVAGSQPFDFDRGMAKTVTIGAWNLEPGDKATVEKRAAAFQYPLFAAAPPEWYCGTGALGELEPYDLDRFPEYETPVEADLDIWMRNRPYGFRNWGDAYMGGPYKGKNAYNNLEYDIPYDFAMQFARTGNRKYLDAMIAGARHQADIDTNHITGQPWKHSPRHTETPAELGHVFLRGLLAYTHLTGDPRGLDTAKQIGDWLCTAINNRGETGNERQIGWGLYALTAVYEATWDPKYLEAMKRFVDRLVTEQEPSGKFNIRWDNRIAFFNGLAMAGLRRYYELTGEERVAEATLRLIDRTLGFYPEYAGRTLDGLTWAYDRTGDPRYLTLLARTWETTLEYCQTRYWGPGTTLFATRYLPFLARHGLAPKPVTPLNLTPAQLTTNNGLYLTRIEAPFAGIRILDRSGKPFRLAITRHGSQDHAIATVSWPSGSYHPHAMNAQYEATSTAVTRQVMEVPAGKPAREINLTLVGLSSKAWDIVTSRPMPRVIDAAELSTLIRFVPRAHFQVTGDRLTANFRAQGEGFHGAVLYDSAGRPVTAVTKFIDLGDDKPTTYALTAAIPPSERGQIWSMDIQDGEMTSLHGAPPVFSSTRAAFFVPGLVVGKRRARNSPHIQPSGH